MKKKEYNWWKDPKNKEEVERLSWWDHEKNKTFVNFPVSIINEGKYWVVGKNEETKKFIGDKLGSVAQGETKEEAIEQFFKMIKFSNDFSEDCRLNYQRWVPFRKGPWGKIGGSWFSIFGIQIYFRYGKNMKMGWYIPLTKLNISISNDWIIYKRYKKARKYEQS